MRKKAFLKAVSLFACFSILMLSVPGVIAADKAPKRTSLNLFQKSIHTLNLLLPFLNLNVNDKDNTSDQTSDEDSVQKIKATGGLKKAMLGDDN